MPLFKRTNDVNIEDVPLSDAGAVASEWGSKGFILYGLIALCLCIAGLSVYWLTPSRPRTLSEIEKKSSVATSDVKVGSDKTHKAKKAKKSGNDMVERNKVTPLADTTTIPVSLEQKSTSLGDVIDVEEETPLNLNKNREEKTIGEERPRSFSNLSNSSQSSSKKKVMFALEDDDENGNESNDNEGGELDGALSKKSKKKEETPEQRVARLLRKKERKREEQERKAELALQEQKAREEALRVMQREALNAAANAKRVVPEVKVQPDEGEWVVQTKNKALKAALEKEMNEKEEIESVEKNSNKNSNKKKENNGNNNENPSQQQAEVEKNEKKKKQKKSKKDKAATGGSGTVTDSTPTPTDGEDDKADPLNLNLKGIQKNKSNKNNAKRNTENSPRSPKNSPRDQSFEQKREQYESRKIKREEEEQRQVQKHTQKSFPLNTSGASTDDVMSIEEMIAAKMGAQTSYNGSTASSNMDVGNCSPPGLSMNKSRNQQQQQPPTSMFAPSDLTNDNTNWMMSTKPSLNDIVIGDLAPSYKSNAQMSGNDVRILNRQNALYNSQNLNSYSNVGASGANPQSMADFESKFF